MNFVESLSYPYLIVLTNQSDINLHQTWDEDEDEDEHGLIGISAHAGSKNMNVVKSYRQNKMFVDIMAISFVF